MNIYGTPVHRGRLCSSEKEGSIAYFKDKIGSDRCFRRHPECLGSLGDVRSQVHVGAFGEAS